jgi:pilus assembly protein CpaD
MTHHATPRPFSRAIATALAAAGLALALGGCTHTSQSASVTGSIPTDYRQRHPIVVQEADQTIDIFVGAGRGGLTASQRAEVSALARTWLREGTGTIIIDAPVHTPNARAATDAVREIRSLFAAAGIPSRGVTTRPYQPSDPGQLATVRITYPRIAAVAGPCGLWPEDLGPSVKNKGYLDNRPYYNLGCASQRNLAAMVDNPHDLVQPRAETPPYTARRNTVFGKYRDGQATASALPENEKAQLSKVGQ